MTPSSGRLRWPPRSAEGVLRTRGAAPLETSGRHSNQSMRAGTGRRQAQLGVPGSKSRSGAGSLASMRVGGSALASRLLAPDSLRRGRADDDRERPGGPDVESVDDFDCKLLHANVVWCTGEAAQCRYQANPVREATAPQLPHRRTNASDGGQFGAVEATDSCAGELLGPNTEPRCHDERHPPPQRAFFRIRRPRDEAVRARRARSSHDRSVITQPQSQRELSGDERPHENARSSSRPQRQPE